MPQLALRVKSVITLLVIDNCCLMNADMGMLIH